MSSDPPRRGKFLTQPPQQPKEPTENKPPSSSGKPAARGKNLGKTLTSPPSANSLTAQGGTAHISENENSLTNLKSIVQQAKEAASKRRKEVSAKRDRIFNDLDEAETIVLSLLDCASQVANSLSEMTNAKVSGNTNSFEDLSSKVRENGVGYLAGVKKLHSLLAPHASFVKLYRQDEGEDNATPEKKSDATNMDEGTISGAIVAKATSNMYAARVEKRLVLERSAVLKEMIRLEELESAGQSGSETIVDDTAAGTKRKHESIE